MKIEADDTCGDMANRRQVNKIAGGVRHDGSQTERLAIMATLSTA